MATPNAKASSKGKGKGKPHQPAEDSDSRSGNKPSPILRITDVSGKPVNQRKQEPSKILLDVVTSKGEEVVGSITINPAGKGGKGKKKASSSPPTPNPPKQKSRPSSPDNRQEENQKPKGRPDKVNQNIPQKAVLIMTTSKELSDALVSGGSFKDHSGAQIEAPAYYHPETTDSVIGAGLKGGIMLFVGAPTTPFPHTYKVLPVCVYRGKTPPLNLLSASAMAFSVASQGQIPQSLLPNIYAAAVAHFGARGGKKKGGSLPDNNNSANARVSD